jgi:hypothetical protein
MEYVPRVGKACAALTATLLLIVIGDPKAVPLL